MSFVGSGEAHENAWGGNTHGTKSSRSNWLDIENVQMCNNNEKSHRTTNRYLSNEGHEWKSGHTNVTVLTGKGGWKKEVKKVDMVDILSM
jgi:hypothetical protein